MSTVFAMSRVVVTLVIVSRFFMPGVLVRRIMMPGVGPMIRIVRSRLAVGLTLLVLVVTRFLRQETRACDVESTVEDTSVHVIAPQAPLP